MTRRRRFLPLREQLASRIYLRRRRLWTKLGTELLNRWP